MRYSWILITCGILLSACDTSRVHEKNVDLANREWLAAEKASFQFEITDTTQAYNVYFNLRNSVSYPFTRIFTNYTLRSPADSILASSLLTQDLFDRKTGEPAGSSALGDLYDHQFPLLTHYTFARKGLYTLTFQQMMRTDTLRGVLAVGYRVERAEE